jgi:hypothetical protein
MHTVRHHLLAAALMLLAAQGTGLVAMAQVGAGSKVGWVCTCGCGSTSPDHHCPMCMRMQGGGSGKCDCAARGTREVPLPWWLDVVALLPALAPISQTVAFVCDLPPVFSVSSNVSRRPPSPPPRHTLALL